MEGDEWLGRPESLVHRESDQADDTEHEHDDNVGGSPLVGGGSGDGERQEEQRQARRDQEDADHWLQRGATT